MSTLDNLQPLAFFRLEGGITARADRKLIAPQHLLHGNCPPGSYSVRDELDLLAKSPDQPEPHSCPVSAPVRP
jgi:hypothetical protein